MYSTGLHNSVSSIVKASYMYVFLYVFQGVSRFSIVVVKADNVRLPLGVGSDLGGEMYDG